MSATTLLIILLVVLLLGGGYGYRSDWDTSRYGGLVGIVLVIVLLLWLTGNLR